MLLVAAECSKSCELQANLNYPKGSGARACVCA